MSMLVYCLREAHLNGARHIRLAERALALMQAAVTRGTHAQVRARQVQHPHMRGPAHNTCSRRRLRVVRRPLSLVCSGLLHRGSCMTQRLEAERDDFARVLFSCTQGDDCTRGEWRRRAPLRPCCVDVCAVGGVVYDKVGGANTGYAQVEATHCSRPR